MRYDYKNPQMTRERDDILGPLLAQRGMVTFLARELGISKAAVAQWFSIPEQHIPTISKLLDIPQYQLRDSKPRKRKAA